MKITPANEIIIGYKATDKDMKCQGYQFEIGKWFIHEGVVKLCKSGFHFCPHMSGVWSYYTSDSSKVWKIEAKEVHQEYEPGADLKYVCKMIRFVEEIKIGGDRNTGYSNTGDRNTGNRNTGDSNTGDSNTGYSNTGYRNTGYRNTGDSNTGDSNTGYSNTGDSNTGDRNTGYSNTGYSNTGDSNTGYGNTGDRNTGYSNTGDSNTGDRNTGDRNTGDSNTGDSNTGYGNTGDSNTGYGNTGDSNTGYRNTGYRNTGYSNATNNSAGFFCQQEPKVICFDKPTKLTHQQFKEKHPEWYSLSDNLYSDNPFDYTKYSSLPNWTLEKCKSLHEKMIKARKQ